MKGSRVYIYIYFYLSQTLIWAMGAFRSKFEGQAGYTNFKASGDPNSEKSKWQSRHTYLYYKTGKYRQTIKTSDEQIWFN